MEKQRKPGSFFNLYRHNFVRVAVAVPEVRVADPAFNAAQTVALMREAATRKAMLAVFPELGLSAYSCEDLFQQQALQEGVLAALAQVAAASRALNLLSVVGAPLRIDGVLYNCAAVICRGQILGVVPKSYPPNYREFYELRHFAPGEFSGRETIDLVGQSAVPFGSRIVFEAEDQPLFSLAVEICEDLWTPIPPTSFAALAGATVLANLSASNINIGKDEYRSQLVANQSGRCLAAYLYSAAGFGESTTDLAWDGHGMVYENGSPLASTQRFKYASQLITADVDLDRLVQDRSRQTSFAQSAHRHAAETARYRRVRFSAGLPSQGTLLLERTFERFPYVPSDPATRDARCRDVYEIQVQGLVKRLRSMGADKVVIGVSGGLDSTQALIVCARAMDVMALPRANILGCTMPGFATSERTLSQARRLMAAIGCTAQEIDIRPSCMQMLADIGHPYAQGKPVHDITFENVQAGERTSHLFRLANRNNAPVVGTSDLSELALGWTTYGVGDHMAHYHVNASVPKTLIQYLIRHVAATRQLGEQTSSVLEAVLSTPISPELVPGSGTDADQPTQSSEAVVGPYELQDFHLYYILRFGFDPVKVAFMAWSAWQNPGVGTWPDVPQSERRAYSIAEIKKWLEVFLERFFQLSQYKRSAIPNSPKVGSGGSLSPRGDWRAPSDGEATAWLARLDEIPDQGPGNGKR
ncbi:MAG: NAD(+) synthase [Betaproteobacteria bacterium]|nr:NAD(+) synthase [Betaproteobacteria bacterium]